MIITRNGSRYIFRACDVKKYTLEQVQRRANESGRVQYEQNNVWLVIPGIGYGMRMEG